MALPWRRFSLEENTITGISDVSCASNRAKRRPAAGGPALEALSLATRAVMR